MEANLSKRGVLTSVINKIKENDIIPQSLKKEFQEFNDKFNVDDSGKKINITLFGHLSAGKTTLINIMIRHLVTQKTNIAYNYMPNINLSMPPQNNFMNGFEEEEEVEEEEDRYDGFVRLITRDPENTYFICLIENSETDTYEIITEINDQEGRQAVSQLIREAGGTNFNSKNQVTLKFSNNEEGIRRMNEFLEDIDNKGQILLENLRKRDLDYTQQITEEFNPSKMTIKIPDFPKEYRLIDSPGLSIPSFRKGLIKIINELNFINFFIYVSEITSKESYSSSEGFMKEVANDYGPPILYSFVTKGNKFLIDFPRINNDYKDYVKMNNYKLRNLKEVKTKYNMEFRLIIPINDKDYNEDVKNCLKVFFADLDKMTREHGIANYEASVIIRLRNKICKMNDRISNELLLSPNQIASIKRSARNASLFYEEKIRDYFEVFTTDLKDFKKRFPDLVNELYEVYDKYEKDNPHNVSRSKYIKRHIELSFEDFQKIISKKPQQLIINAFQQIYDNVDEETQEKIKLRLSDEGIFPEISGDFKIGLFLVSYMCMATGAILIAEFLSLRVAGLFAGEAIALAIGAAVVPVVGWVVGGIGLVVSVSDFIGIWIKKNTREDITKGLLDWLGKNKGKIVKDTLENYKRFSDTFIEKLNNYKVMGDQCKDLLSECDKFKGDIRPFPAIDHKQELLNILTNRRLKTFFTKVFDYEEEEEAE